MLVSPESSAPYTRLVPLRNGEASRHPPNSIAKSRRLMPCMASYEADLIVLNGGAVALCSTGTIAYQGAAVGCCTAEFRPCARPGLRLLRVDTVEKGFCRCERATLIQGQALARNVDSRIHSA
jgi:hypothetical protein